MKKWIVRITLVLLAVFVLLGLAPFSREIHYTGTEYEFSLAGDAAVAEHQVIIDGTYSSSLFLKDWFSGTFYVSDVEGLTEDMYVNFSFEPAKRYHPAFAGKAGQPHSTEIAVLFFEKNFESLAIQFTTKYEKDADSITASYGDGTSNFMVLGAKNKQEALAQYQELMKDRHP